MRRHEAAEAEDEPQQEREAEQVGVEQRHRGEQGSARQIAGEHRRAASEPLDQSAAENAEERCRKQLGDKNERHLGG
ncbi:MAG: hypothetical protein WKF65_07905 [Gaiellaceae bacterium]